MRARIQGGKQTTKKNPCSIIIRGPCVMSITLLLGSPGDTRLFVRSFVRYPPKIIVLVPDNPESLTSTSTFIFSPRAHPSRAHFLTWASYQPALDVWCVVESCTCCRCHRRYRVPSTSQSCQGLAFAAFPNRPSTRYLIPDTIYAPNHSWSWERAFSPHTIKAATRIAAHGDEVGSGRRQGRSLEEIRRRDRSD
jgi:hypothetical protein